jgi:N-acetylmuramoyl-L-alanine amidase
MKVCISAGHAEDVQGAVGPSPWGLNEVDEARRVVTKTAEYLRQAGIEAETWWDDVSESQAENLDRIVAWHNNAARGEHQLDCSIHFNAYQVTTTKPMGCECLHYPTNDDTAALSAKIAATMANAMSLPNRGAKPRSDLAFINGCRADAILVETVFVDAKIDCDNYSVEFDGACLALAESIAGKEIGEPVEPPEPIEPPVEPPLPSGENRVDIAAAIRGDVTIIINGTRVRGHRLCEHVVDLTIGMTGDVTLVIQGEEFHSKPPTPPAAEIQANHRDVMASVFGGESDPNHSAYPPYDSAGNGEFLDDTEFYVAIPVNVSDEDARLRGVRVYNRATGESEIGRIRDKGPWMVDDTAYCYGDAEAISVTCYREHQPLPSGPRQGQIPNNEAAIDLSPALAEAIGIDGLGRVDWEFVEGEEV